MSVERIGVVGQIHPSEEMTSKLKSITIGSPIAIISVVKAPAQFLLVLVEALKGSIISMKSLMTISIVTGVQRKRALLVQSEAIVNLLMLVTEVIKETNLK
jgi:hypothetical protein